MGKSKLDDLLGIPWSLGQFDARVTLTLDQTFDENEYVGPQRLEAKVAAKHTARDTSDKEKQCGRDYQEPGQPKDVLRINNQIEQVEFSAG